MIPYHIKFKNKIVPIYLPRHDLSLGDRDYPSM